MIFQLCECVIFMLLHTKQNHILITVKLFVRTKFFILSIDFLCQSTSEWLTIVLNKPHYVYQCHQRMTLFQHIFRIKDFLLCHITFLGRGILHVKFCWKFKGIPFFVCVLLDFSYLINPKYEISPLDVKN